ncbi:dienelactone hydrolase family protein [Saccharopolyspora halophila]|uniref:Dienelactone hydrolase family protein n=1 Tax=Saccharopolyspora halophila TaxID=405551 RepID=A0ABN3GH05_9PSEU
MPSMLEWGAGRDAAEIAVLAVHGRGGNPESMREISDRFGPTPAQFFAPEAPGNTWYPQPFLQSLEANEPALSGSLATVDECLEELAASGFGPERVVLWGFSQGACLVSHRVLTAPRRYRGLIAFTGGYIGPDEITAPGAVPLAGMPALLRSVSEDPWVPSHRVEATAEALRAAGAEVDLRIAPGDQHIVTDEACAAATEFLAS